MQGEIEPTQGEHERNKGKPLNSEELKMSVWL